MKSTIISFLGSRVTTITVMLLYALLLGVVTFIEKYYGTDTAKTIYFSPFVGVLWLLMIANWLVQTVRSRISIKNKFAYYVLHSSFVFILGGAAITHFCGVEGLLHIREGEQTDEFVTNARRKAKLPFKVYLDDFQLVRYSGSNSPRSYKSIVTIDDEGMQSQMEVYMNKVISVRGYRFFQTAYDKDEAGTILTVSYDPIGMAVTYIGYAMMFLGILLIPFRKNSRLRVLIGRLSLLSILLLIPLCARSQPDWGNVRVQNPNGRIEPFDTYCRTLTRKIHHKESVNDIRATEFILGLMGNPSYWNAQPVIYQANKEIQQSLGKDGKYLCFNDVFGPDGNYLLQDELENIYNRPANMRDKRQKDLLKLDEKLNIMLAVEQGRMLRLFPLRDDARQRWFSPGDDLSAFSGDDSIFVSHAMALYLSTPNQEIADVISTYQIKRAGIPLPSDARMRFEILYNEIRPFYLAAIANLICGTLLLLFLFMNLVNKQSSAILNLCRLFTALTLVSFAVMSAGLIVRWYISGQAPWSNAYESMVYAAWCTLSGSIIFIHRSRITLALGALFSGILLLVSNMNWMDPAITPLVPVLQSYWLMIHVAVIMSGYGFFAISFLLGLANLIIMALPKPSPLIKKKIDEMAIINEIALIIGLCLMTAGTFLGAVWANEAWGRYWGWDPKETWALITVIVYVAITHARFIRKLDNPFALGAMSVFGFSTVMMTYLGVNYFFSGMHSYGSGDAHIEIYFFVILYAIISVICIFAYCSYKNLNITHKNE